MFSSNFLNALYIIPILAVLILIHEFGHFVTARICGVKVEEFGIGIPPRIVGWTRRGVLWSINAIPFGGFVRVKGEDGKNLEPDSMNAKPAVQRAFFLSAGAGMNVILAVVLMILVVGIQGVPHNDVYIVNVMAGSPAAKAGWQPGDRIVAIDGNRVETTDKTVQATAARAGEPMTVTVERRGKLVNTTLTPRQHPPKGEGKVGVVLQQKTIGKLYAANVVAGSPAAAAGIQPGDRLVAINNRDVTDSFVFTTELNRYAGFSVPVTVERGGRAVSVKIDVPKASSSQDILLTTGLSALRQKPTFERVPALKVIPRGFQEAFHATREMVLRIKELFSSRENLKQVAGPIGMGQLTSELIQESTLPLWVTIADITIVLSLNLAVLNLLPLPALDGGRLFFVLIEVLRGGRRIAPEKEGLIHFAGIILLIGFMFVVGFFDINRLLDGRSFLP